ncbi:MAG: hypothetical protein Q7S92_04810 [Candidatus Diapherotrites archaeon]|nr:hypothetical protein [Candidatus Diapherotrites archaeon]
MKNQFQWILIIGILLISSGCIKTEYIESPKNEGYLLYYSFSPNQVLEYTIQTTIQTPENDPETIIKKFNRIPKLIGNPNTLEILTTDANRLLIGSEAEYLETNILNICGSLTPQTKDYLIQFYPNGEIRKENIQSVEIYLPAYSVKIEETWKFNSVNYALKEEILADFNGAQIPVLKIMLAKKTETEEWTGTALFDHQNHRLVQLDLEKIALDQNITSSLKLLNIQENITQNQLNFNCLNQATIIQ